MMGYELEFEDAVDVSNLQEIGRYKYNYNYIHNYINGNNNRSQGEHGAASLKSKKGNGGKQHRRSNNTVAA